MALKTGSKLATFLLLFSPVGCGHDAASTPSPAGSDAGLDLGSQSDGQPLDAAAPDLPVTPDSIGPSALDAALPDLAAPDGSAAVSFSVAKSTAARAVASFDLAGDGRTLAADNQAFALTAYQRLAASQANFTFSPVSISLALAMTYAGAASTTASQMASALHFSLPPDRLHAAMNALDQALGSRSQAQSRWIGDLPLRLSIVNGLWAQKGFAFKTPFLDTLATYYGAGVNLVDFALAPEASRLVINDWVSSITDGLIPNILPAGAIDDKAKAVLTNALLFEAGWQSPFDQKKTQPGAFHRLDGSDVTAQLMHATTSLPAMQASNLVAVSLPYQYGQLSLLVVVPDSGKFTEVESALDTAALDGIVAGLQTRSVELALPRFAVQTATSITSLLSGMGMPEAFTEFADFSAMSNTRLFIQDVQHSTSIEVSEVGSKAASSTAVIMYPVMDGGVPQSLPVTVDRPFLFFLRDEPTHSILFMGRVVDPSRLIGA